MSARFIAFWVDLRGNVLSQSLVLNFLIIRPLPSTYAAEQKTLANIHAYPKFSDLRASEASEGWTSRLVAAFTSAQAATMELKTIRPNENRTSGVTRPPDKRTSPYAITMMVRFLKMVNTGTERNCKAFPPV